MASVERCTLLHVNVSHVLMDKPILTTNHKIDFKVGRDEGGTSG